MPVVEGEGLVKPAPVKITVQQSDIRSLHDEAERRSAFRNYAHKTSVWGRGMMTKGAIVETVGKEVKPGTLAILVGMAGEYAVGTFINESLGGSKAAVDLSLLTSGDGGRDFRIFGLSIDVKTRKFDYGANLVRATDATGRILSLRSDVYLFCEWRLRCEVILLGWDWQRHVRNWKKTQSDKDGHWNFTAEDIDLLPMCRLIDELRTRRELESL